MALLHQLIHCSDLHFGANTRNLAAARRDLKRLFWSLPAQLKADLFDQGYAAHDPLALIEFDRALRALKAAAPMDWPRTTLVVTGDLATLGEARTIQAVVQRMRQLSSHVGLGTEPILLYGNHDVWREELPLYTSARQLEANRTALRRVPPFDGRWPAGHASSSPRVELHSMNTIVHESSLNTLACGRVGDDRYWQGAGLQDQAAELAAVPSRPGTVKILLSHHPLFEPSTHPRTGKPIPPFVKKIVNAAPVAAQLAPAYQVLLSGHTHYTFPEVTQLPSVLPAGAPGYPRSGQLQLIVGTLSQRGMNNSAAEHAFQVLRLEDIPGDNTAVQLSRVVFERSLRAGPFEPRRTAQNRILVEDCRIA
jgi:predicted MPP superfamily phosphohydrolase